MKNSIMSLVFCVLCACSTMPAASPGPATTLPKIITNKIIWGPDFPVALTYLRNWHDAGESMLIIYPNRIIGGTAYKSADAAAQSLGKTAPALKKPPYTVKSSMRNELTVRSGTLEKLGLRITTVAEDSSHRIEWSSADSKFIADHLTIEEVYEQIGKPEKITTQLLEGRGEARPTILTLHHYAKSAIVFAESDLSPIPGLIDRVFLDIPAVSKTVFEEGQ